jgi:hypothetical protein
MCMFLCGSVRTLPSAGSDAFGRAGLLVASHGIASFLLLLVPVYLKTRNIARVQRSPASHEHKSKANLEG